MSLSPTATLHLQWIKKHPLFVCDWCFIAHNQTYYEVVNLMYLSMCEHTDNMVNVEKCINRFFHDDLLLFDSYENALALKKVEYNIGSKQLAYFCTIGFNHQTYTISSCVDVINTILTFPWVLSCRAIFEFHRENGEHPHCHFLINTDIQKSKVVEKIWATKGIKKICLKKSFIDVKLALPVHSKYIMLEKQESKMAYVAKDIIWRKNNAIPEFFEK